MSNKQEQNKALVLEAFDTLFNRRDYDRAKNYQVEQAEPNFVGPHRYLAMMYLGSEELSRVLGRKQEGRGPAA